MLYKSFKDKKTIQPKLRVGETNDAYEQEADRVANAITQNTNTDNSIQRQCEDCEEEALQMKSSGNNMKPIQRMEEEEEALQMKGYAEGAAVDEHLEDQLTQSKGKGEELPAPTRQKMEQGMGSDFSDVKIHRDQEAQQMNSQLNARAFTNGQDIYFNSGEYQPDSSKGQHLLAHELAHVVQQNGKKGNIQKKQSARKTYPWDGEIIGAWSAALRSSASKDSANPHANTVADLPKKHPVNVVSNSKGWLKVNTTLNGKALSGYVSQELVGLTSENSTALSQTITDGPSAAYNKTFGWDSKFRLIFDYYKKQLTVRVKLFSTATKAQKGVWKSAIESKWNNKKKLQVVEDASKPTQKDTYKIKFEIDWAADAASAHYTINLNPGTTTGGTAGVGGTTSMTDWGENDRVDVPHEFGHMMGNKDEYFTVDGVAHGAHRQTGKGLMNNPSEDPFSRHFNLIKAKAAATLKIPVGQCTII